MFFGVCQLFGLVCAGMTVLFVLIMLLFFRNRMGLAFVIDREGVNALVTSAKAKAGARKPAIALERTSVTGLRHRDGALSMARSGPDTAQSSFFICINDQPSLDFGGQRNKDGQGFAAFGRVTRGMDVVRRIQASPAEKQALSPPIAIVRVRRR